VRLTRRTWILLLVLVFVTAFALRGLAIKLTPRGDHFVDMEIYRASGDLILNGVNPYDFSDNVALRSALRQQARNPLLRDNQAFWDFEASSNLPLNLLLFAGLRAVSRSLSDSPLVYRYTYAFFDSVLSALIVWFVIRHWPQGPGALSVLFRRLGMALSTAVFAERLAIGLALGCLSPVLFKHGVAYPEDKGIQILLMLGAIACWLSDDDRIWFWGGAVLLGLSIAFKGLGIFLVPIFASRLLALPTRVWSRSFVFALVAFLVAAVWFLPFGPAGVIHMVETRMNVGSNPQPFHASIWVFPSRYLPSGWRVLRLFAVTAFIAVSAIAYWRKRTNLAEFCVELVFAFTVVWLINGAMHRMNVAIVLVLLLLGAQRVNAAMVCLIPYLATGVGGLLTPGARGENLEAGGNLILAATYLAVLCWIAFSPRSKTTKEVAEIPAT